MGIRSPRHLQVTFSAGKSSRTCRLVQGERIATIAEVSISVSIAAATGNKISLSTGQLCGVRTGLAMTNLRACRAEAGQILQGSAGFGMARLAAV